MQRSSYCQQCKADRAIGHFCEETGLTALAMTLVRIAGVLGMAGIVMLALGGFWWIMSAATFLHEWWIALPLMGAGGFLFNQWRQRSIQNKYAGQLLGLASSFAAVLPVLPWVVLRRQAHVFPVSKFPIN